MKISEKQGPDSFHAICKVGMGIVHPAALLGVSKNYVLASRSKALPPEPVRQRSPRFCERLLDRLSGRIQQVKIRYRQAGVAERNKRGIEGRVVCHAFSARVLADVVVQRLKNELEFIHVGQRETSGAEPGVGPLGQSVKYSKSGGYADSDNTYDHRRPQLRLSKTVCGLLCGLNSDCFIHSSSLMWGRA